MKKGMIILVAIAVFAACATAQTKQEGGMKLTEKEKAVALITSLETGDPGPVQYIDPNRYIQHNLMAADGLEGFAELMKQVPKGSVKAKVMRAFQDGAYVFLHTQYDFFGPKIGFDIFRFENGLIVEHWDNLQPLARETASGRSQFDGPTRAVDLEKTEANKLLVKGFVADVLQGGAPGRITEYIAPDHYLQHNPAVGDGLAALGKALEDMARQGVPMTYRRNHMILGEGDFVLTVSEGQFLGRPACFYDLFRVENGRIVEHWDTIEEIPPRKDWKNGNGKF